MTGGFVGTASPAWADTCVRAHLQEALSSVSAAREAAPLHRDPAGAASRALGRKLSKLQKRRLLNALQMTPEEIEFGVLASDRVSSAEGLRQERLLRGAGFTGVEIAQLRETQVLPKVLPASFEPGGAEYVEPANYAQVDLRLKDIDRRTVAEMRDGKRYSYILDPLGNYQLFDDAKVHFDPESYWIIRDPDSGSRLLVQEGGTVHYDPKAGKFFFEPEYGQDFTGQDFTGRMSDIEAESGVVASEQAERGANEFRALDCLDVLQSQTSGGTFVLDRVGADLVVTSAVVGYQEAKGVGRLKKKNGMKIIAADLVGGAATGIASSFVGKVMIVNNSGDLLSMISRLVLGQSLNEIQHLVTRVFIDDQNDNSAERIRSFNRTFSTTRLPVAFYTDKFLLKNLPWVLHDVCRKGGAVRFLLSPRSARLVIQVGTSYIYYTLRAKVTGR